eukprot:1157626-Pelagomonas_calceolata.AAC.21
MSAARAVLPSSVAALAVSSSMQAADEAVAVAMSDGRLALLRSCEEDLWEETLEVRAVCACGVWVGRKAGKKGVGTGLLAFLC